MKNLFRSIAFIFAAFAFVRPAVPAFVNFNVPNGLTPATVATMTDSDMLYIVYPPANTNANFRRISLLGLRTYGAGQTTDSVYRQNDTLTGLTTTVTDSVTCTKASGSGQVTVRMGTATGTSNATAHYLAHLCGDRWQPIAATPIVLAQITDTSTVFYSVKAVLLTSDSLQFTNNATAFKNTGTFAVLNGMTFTYTIR